MSDSADTQVLTVTTTVATVEAARELARRLLDERLAACVQLDGGITSLYRWEGKLCEEPEVRLVIKTLPACEAAVRELFARHHPYQLPQFVAAVGEATPAYAGWVRGEVEPRA
jgi:periplasmic divalent cation tolerance protein